MAIEAESMSKNHSSRGSFFRLGRFRRGKQRPRINVTTLKADGTRTPSALEVHEPVVAKTPREEENSFAGQQVVATVESDETQSMKSGSSKSFESYASNKYNAADESKGKFVREHVTLDTPPPAREAAFTGPPRYDWIDIETAAAIKVQAAFRRIKVMRDMEKEGLTTSAIRNRARRRQKQMGRRNNLGVAGGEDIPSLFRCCGIGLAFGDASEEMTYDIFREHQKNQYEERQKKKDMEEEKLRQRVLKQYWKKRHNAPADAEAYEVVE